MPGRGHRVEEVVVLKDERHIKFARRWKRERFFSSCGENLSGTLRDSVETEKRIGNITIHQPWFSVVIEADHPQRFPSVSTPKAQMKEAIDPMHGKPELRTTVHCPRGKIHASRCHSPYQRGGDQEDDDGEDDFAGTEALHAGMAACMGLV